MPIIVSVHIPLVTAFYSYVPAPQPEPKHDGRSVVNAYEVIALFEGHNVIWGSGRVTRTLTRK